MVKNPSSNAGDAGSIPSWGTKIPHAVGQLSPRATTTEPTRSGATTRESRPAHHNSREASTVQQKIPHAATKTQCSQKDKENKYIFLKMSLEAVSSLIEPPDETIALLTP